MTSFVLGAKTAMDNIRKGLQIFAEGLETDKCAVSIHSRTPCHSCGYALLDEEILSLWCGNDMNAKGSNPSLSLLSENFLDIIGAHDLTCPQCKSQFKPLLHVRFHSKSLETIPTEIKSGLFAL